MKDRFPILLVFEGNSLGRISSVPIYAAELARVRMERNHGQTLERLAERGGLGRVEFYLAWNDLGLDEEAGLKETDHKVVTLIEAVQILTSPSWRCGNCYKVSEGKPFLRKFFPYGKTAVYKTYCDSRCAMVDDLGSQG